MEEDFDGLKIKVRCYKCNQRASIVPSFRIMNLVRKNGKIDYESLSMSSLYCKKCNVPVRIGPFRMEEIVDWYMEVG